MDKNTLEMQRSVLGDIPMNVSLSLKSEQKGKKYQRRVINHSSLFNFLNKNHFSF